MSRVFVCLFVFSILSISVRFGDCENITSDTQCQDVNITSGSDKTRVSNFEKSLSGLKSHFDALGNMGKRKNETQSYGNVLEKFKDVHIIYPGTQWCGNGNISRNEDNLGLFKEVDACCRQHDNCKNFILPGETEVNLNNNGIFTRSACSCDTQFYKCLKDSSRSISNLSERIVISQIGNTYFNLLRPQCFQCICPMEDCNLKDGTECKDHCMKYEWVNNVKY